MANEIDKTTLPEVPKSYLELERTDSDIATTDDDKYLLRILIDKVNELVQEVNTIKDALSGD